MNFSPLFQRYETLVIKADEAFKKMANDYSECIKCKRHCSDCCHAVFGLFLIEAAFLRHHFDQLGREDRRAILIRSNKADRDLEKLKERLQIHKDDPRMSTYALARERIRCPLLDNKQECVLYLNRPITCRAYGIPTKIHGRAHICGKAGFKKGEYYPAFDIDGVYQDLFLLSKELLKSMGSKKLEKASLLISVSKALSTPLKNYK